MNIKIALIFCLSIFGITQPIHILNQSLFTIIISPNGKKPQENHAIIYTQSSVTIDNEFLSLLKPQESAIYVSWLTCNAKYIEQEKITIWRHGIPLDKKALRFLNKAHKQKRTVSMTSLIANRYACIGLKDVESDQTITLETSRDDKHSYATFFDIAGKDILWGPASRMEELD